MSRKPEECSARAEVSRRPGDGVAEYAASERGFTQQIGAPRLERAVASPLNAVPRHSLSFRESAWAGRVSSYATIPRPLAGREAERVRRGSNCVLPPQRFTPFPAPAPRIASADRESAQADGSSDRESGSGRSRRSSRPLHSTPAGALSEPGVDRTSVRASHERGLRSHAGESVAAGAGAAYLALGERCARSWDRRLNLRGGVPLDEADQSAPGDCRSLQQAAEVGLPVQEEVPREGVVLRLLVRHLGDALLREVVEPRVRVRHQQW